MFLVLVVLFSGLVFLKPVLADCSFLCVGSCGGDTCSNGSISTCPTDQRCADVGGDTYDCVPDNDCSPEDPVDPGSPSININIIDVNELLSTLFDISFPFALGIGLFMIVKAGYSLKLSEGNPQKVAEAKEDLTAALIGVLFILLSLTILRLIITSFLGPLI